jgi:hypothetical protein
LTTNKKRKYGSESNEIAKRPTFLDKRLVSGGNFVFKLHLGTFSLRLRLYSVLSDKDGVEFSFEKSGNLPGYLLSSRKGRLILTGQKVVDLNEYIMILVAIRRRIKLLSFLPLFCRLFSSIQKRTTNAKQ